MRYLWLLLAIASSTVLAGDVSPATSDFFPCRSCHGDNGWGSEATRTPAIAGQDAGYLSRQLHSYRDGGRGNHPGDPYGRQMALMAANLDEQSIARLAEYISAMPPPPARLEARPNQPGQ